MFMKMIKEFENRKMDVFIPVSLVKMTTKDGDEIIGVKGPNAKDFIMLNHLIKFPKKGEKN